MTSIATSFNQPKQPRRLVGAEVDSHQAGVMSGIDPKEIQNRWSIGHPFTFGEAGR